MKQSYNFIFSRHMLENVNKTELRVVNIYTVRKRNGKWRQITACQRIQRNKFVLFQFKYTGN